MGVHLATRTSARVSEAAGVVVALPRMPAEMRDLELWRDWLRAVDGILARHQQSCGAALDTQINEPIFTVIINFL